MLYPVKHKPGYYSKSLKEGDARRWRVIANPQGYLTCIPVEAVIPDMWEVLISINSYFTNARKHSCYCWAANQYNI